MLEYASTWWRQCTFSKFLLDSLDDPHFYDFFPFLVEDGGGLLEE